MDHWNVMNCVARVQERQAALEEELKRRRLLRELAGSTEQFVLFRKAVLLTGNLLIATGLWLKRRAAPTQNHSQRPSMVGRFS